MGFLATPGEDPINANRSRLLAAGKTEAPLSGGFMLSLLDGWNEEGDQDGYDGDDDEAGPTEG